MKPYKPDKLPLEKLDYQRLITFVSEANTYLARYDGLLQGIVNPGIMLSPLIREEAVLSSRIEGTQATVDEVLEHEAGLLKEGEKAEDIREIINYLNALTIAFDYLKERPVSLSFIRQLHRILMDGVRGKDKNPGEFRKNQNWIGSAGCMIEQAIFIPPNPLQMPDHLEAWQQYVEFDDIELLVQTAILHAQFELIHPFEDGNGRIGRILIPLLLYKKKKLSQPMFYLSAYLESHRDEYYQRLQDISRKSDWNGWIEFFLTAVIKQAENNNIKVKKIMNLYAELKNKIQEITHSQYSIKLLDAIFERPLFDNSHFIKAGIPGTSVKRLINILQKNDILKVIRPGKGRVPAIYCFPKLLRIVEGKQ